MGSRTGFDTNTEVLVLRNSAKENRFNDFVWNHTIGAVNTAPDWDPDPRLECGAALHGLEWGCGTGGLLVGDENGVVLAVRKAEIVPPRGWDTEKIRFRSGRVVFVGSMKECSAFICEYVPLSSPVQWRSGEYRGASMVNGGVRSDITVGSSAIVSVDRDSIVHALNNCTVSLGHNSLVVSGSRARVTAGSACTITTGSDSNVVCGNSSVVKVGVLSTATAGPSSLLTGGPHSVLVSGNNSIYKGEKDATFIDGLLPGTVAVVGRDGVKADCWYQLGNGGGWDEVPEWRVEEVQDGAGASHRRWQVRL